MIIDCRCPGSSSGVFDVLVEDTTYYRMSEISAIIGKGRNKAPTLTEQSEIFQYNTPTPTTFTDQLRKEVNSNDIERLPR